MMSLSEQKQIDAIVSWSFKGIMSLMAFGFTIVFYSMWNGQTLMRDKQEIMNNRLIRVELDQQYTKESLREIQTLLKK
jgi:hypothetical protein